MRCFPVSLFSGKVCGEGGGGGLKTRKKSNKGMRYCSQIKL